MDFPAMIFRTEKRSSPTVKRSQNQHPLAPRARTRPVSSAVIPSFQTLGSFAYSALHRLWLAALTILENDGVRQWGWDDISAI